jgi:hypothetical protein
MPFLCFHRLIHTRISTFFLILSVPSPGFKCMMRFLNPGFICSNSSSFKQVRDFSAARHLLCRMLLPSCHSQFLSFQFVSSQLVQKWPGIPYVDGFNLYYGAAKNTPFKWVDPSALCAVVLPGISIGRIRYFTALVAQRPQNPRQYSTFAWRTSYPPSTKNRDQKRAEVLTGTRKPKSFLLIFLAVTPHLESYFCGGMPSCFFHG